MSYTFWEYLDDQFQGLDYVYSPEDKLFVMLPHGNESGAIFDRAGNEITEEFVYKIAEMLRIYVSGLYAVEPESIQIAAAPCYPNQVRQNMKRIEVLGDWDTPTYAAKDSIDWAFVIKSWNITIRNR